MTAASREYRVRQRINQVMKLIFKLILSIFHYKIIKYYSWPWGKCSFACGDSWWPHIFLCY